MPLNLFFLFFRIFHNFPPSSLSSLQSHVPHLIPPPRNVSSANSLGLSKYSSSHDYYIQRHPGKPKKNKSQQHRKLSYLCHQGPSCYLYTSLSFHICWIQGHLLQIFLPYIYLELYLTHRFYPRKFSTVKNVIIWLFAHLHIVLRNNIF